MPTLYDLTRSIRSFLGNEGFYRHGLDSFHHAHASAAARTLEDAELAIADYLENEPSGKPGFDYLRTYGVLQAAYVQQDPAKLLRQAFRLPSDKWPQALRDLRNRVGHPVDDPKKKTACDTHRSLCDVKWQFGDHPHQARRYFA